MEDKTREKEDQEGADVSKKGLIGGLVVRNEGEGSRVTPGWAESGAAALCRETEHHRGEGSKVNSGCARFKMPVSSVTSAHRKAQ